MKSVILVKQHPNVQLGHLYEHLFMRAVNEFFYEKQLYKSVDYAASGATYDEGGVIVVDVELYSSRAQEYAGGISELKIDLDPSGGNIERALLQMSAEESWRIHISDKLKTVAMLQSLDTAPWLWLDEIDAIDTRSIRRKLDPIYLTNKVQAKPRVLSITLRNKPVVGEACAALLAFVSRIALLTVSNMVTGRYGHYAGDITYSRGLSATRSSLLVASYPRVDVNVPEVSKYTKELIGKMFSRELCERIAQDLNTTNYANQSYVAPNYERILQQSGVLVGSKGWQQITWKDVHDVLNGATLEVKYGRTKEEVTLKLK